MNRRPPLPVFLAPAPGLPVPGDYLARLLHQGDIGRGVMPAGVVVAMTWVSLRRPG